MSEPKLTIGIPTLNRADMLHRAIDSCLRGTIPCRIIVADQGHTDEVALVMQRYADHPHVEHIQTEATCLWENWEAAARACDTPYFAWCQDDDVVGRGYAKRIVTAFDAWPDALHWQARCHNGKDEHMGAWFSGNGPWVPMELLDGRPACWHGQVIVPTMYFTSWSLSPGVAFRCGKEFNDALEQMPTNCDLFAERLILAFLGAKGRFVADPVIAGYWIHHGGNESYKQHASQAEQEKISVAILDDIMDTCEWQDLFAQWCAIMPVANVVQWSQYIEKLDTRHKEELVTIMQGSLQGRIEVIHQAPAPASADPDGELLWTGEGCDTSLVGCGNAG